ncbi:ASCH domain-containing protein [Streptomyces sp. NPDC051561]|uniref:ASCH domain-containing protein n=1 Tax=Streptomyces sp. NPDC051561 TaxID=3365658 RepID=UPI0037A537DA
MKTLTLKQPWADAVAHGTKRTENRTWTTAYRGRLAIHSGAGYDPMGRFLITDRDALNSWPDTRGAVVAVADLVDVHFATDGCCSPWGELHTYHWVLDRVTALATPLPVKGRQRLWNLPDLLNDPLLTEGN